MAYVPVREVEAWMLVDGDALRAAFGTTLGDDDLQVVERPRDAERVLDPRQRFQTALSRATGTMPQRRSKPGSFYDRIGERVDLSKLSHVPAFSRLTAELRLALIELGILIHN